MTQFPLMRLTSRGHALDGQGVTLLEGAHRERVGQLLAAVAEDPRSRRGN